MAQIDQAARESAQSMYTDELTDASTHIYIYNDIMLIKLAVQMRRVPSGSREHASEVSSIVA